MKRCLLFPLVSMAVTALPLAAAHADEAIVTVGPSEPRPVIVYAPPPPSYLPAPVPHPVLAEPDTTLPEEPYRSPFRFQVVGAGVTTGRGLGAGMGMSVDFGRDAVGFRLAATWVRGEPAPSPLSDGLAQYTAEFTYDLHHQGPLHPVFGLGFGLAYVSRGSGAGNVGIGTARFGLEYALPLESADVRFALGITGVLPGPSDTQVADVRSYAVASAGVGVGF